MWLIDGVEYDGKDLVGVVTALDASQARAGIASALFADSWCGYRGLHVTYSDGSRLTERYDAATGRVVRALETADAVVATSEAA